MTSPIRFGVPQPEQQDLRHRDRSTDDLTTRWSVIDRRTAAVTLGVSSLAVGTWPLIAAPPGPSPTTATIAHISGMLAGFGVLVLLTLVSRAPALERGIGADVLARWHSRSGRVVVGLVLLHAWAAVTAWAQSRQVGMLLAGWQVLGLPALPAATAGTLLLLVAAGVSVRVSRRRVRHEKWHGLHLLMYLAVALGFTHELAGPDLVGHPILQLGWALAYAYVFALVLWNRVLTPLRQAGRHRLRVSDVRAEGPGVMSIVVTGEHLGELNATSGHFFRWRFLTPDHWRNAHPFSLSAPPNETSLRLTVKALGDGSTGLQNVSVGTWVVAEGPYGAITSARRTRRSVLLIAGGVGITPMRALFETLHLAPGGDLLLLYRARNPEDVLFRREIDDIAARRGARVVYLVGANRDGLSANGLQVLVPDIAARDVFLCGPPGLTSAVRKSLRQAGVPPQSVHEERFDF